MGRKPRTDPNAPGADAEKPGLGHNGPDLSDAERQTLAFHHKDRYTRALEKKKTADAEFKNVCKVAKAEVGDGAVEIIKDLIALDEPEGEEGLRDRLKRQADALRWAGVPLGTQVELALQGSWGENKDRAYEAGARASAENKPAKPGFDPDTPLYRSYMEGYAAHQSELAAKLGAGNQKPAAPF